LVDQVAHGFREPGDFADSPNIHTDHCISLDVTIVDGKFFGRYLTLPGVTRRYLVMLTRFEPWEFEV
jgi:hypothetical protein